MNMASSIFLRQLSILSKHGQYKNGRKLFRCFSDQQSFDIIISGGGMVGAAMAGALAKDPILANQRILLLEAGPHKTYNHPMSVPPTYSSRVCALSTATVKLLSEIGAWENIHGVRCKEVKRMQVWESGSQSTITFNRQQLTDNLAYIVENDVILSGIMQQISEVDSSRVQIQYNARVNKYLLPGAMNTTESSEDDLPRVQLENGDIYTTKLLIGADGFRSLVRQSADIHSVQWDYDQCAVVATLQLAEGKDNNTAWQRFTKTGPVAMLPLSDEYSCLIWTTTPTDAKRLVQLPAESFVDAVNHAFWSDSEVDPTADSVGEMFDNLLTTFGCGSSGRQLPPTVLAVEDNTRGMFPLGLSHASRYVAPRLALIGDSAHRVHPLAGQGVNLGFGDVRSLRDQLSSSVYSGHDIGAAQSLLDYERERQSRVVLTLGTVDGLQRLYSSSWTPLVVLRSLGLQATNALRPVKDRLIAHATS